MVVVGQNKIRWQSFDNINEKLTKANKKFIVYFYFDGCKWCRYMEDNTLANDQISKFINQNYYIYKVNALHGNKIVVGNRSFTSVHIGKYDFNELATELLNGDMSFPALVFLDEKFNKIQSIEGYYSQEEFEVLLSYFAGNHHKNTMFKKFANNYCKDSHFNSLVNEKH